MNVPKNVRIVSLIAVLATGGLVGLGAAWLGASDALAVEDTDEPKPGSSTTSTSLMRTLPPSGINKIPEIMPNTEP